jgi:hypothetical protein
MTDSLHLSISESDDFNRNKRSSISSIRSGVSVSSPYEVPSDYLSFSDEQSQMQRRPSKKTVSTFIGKLYRYFWREREREKIVERNRNLPFLL